MSMIIVVVYDGIVVLYEYEYCSSVWWYCSIDNNLELEKCTVIMIDQ